MLWNTRRFRQLEKWSFLVVLCISEVMLLNTRHFRQLEKWPFLVVLCTSKVMLWNTRRFRQPEKWLFPVVLWTRWCCGTLDISDNWRNGHFWLSYVPCSLSSVYGIVCEMLQTWEMLGHHWVWSAQSDVSVNLSSRASCRLTDWLPLSVAWRFANWWSVIICWLVVWKLTFCYHLLACGLQTDSVIVNCLKVCSWLSLSVDLWFANWQCHCLLPEGLQTDSLLSSVNSGFANWQSVVIC